MKLPNFVIPHLINKEFTSTGLDSLRYCLNKQHFQNFPHQIIYKYNARGFRDKEWPTDLQNCVWCVGDSFTVGLGLPFDLTWPQQLQTLLDCPVITVAMDGASNQWIFRKTQAIQQEIKPKYIVTMWSYFHRREDIDETIDDLARRKHGSPDTEVEDFLLFESLITQLDSKQLVNLLIPNFHNIDAIQKIWDDIRDISWPETLPNSLTSLPKEIYKELFTYHKIGNHLDLLLTLKNRLQCIQEKFVFLDYKFEDFARDYHHFGQTTSCLIARKVFNAINRVP
jgi:hypothetical protein